MKKTSLFLLSLLLVFTMTGNVGAVVVMPGLDLESVDGVDIDLIKYNKNACYDSSTKTLNLNLSDGYDTGILNWNKFNLQNGYTLNYGAGTFINNVLSGVTNINGTLNGLNANVYINALGGAIIGNKADINVKYGMISTLPTKETDIVALRARIENDKMLELEIANPDSSTRYGILVENNAKMTYTNRLDLVSAKIIGTNKKDLVSDSPNLVYTTTDGIVFNLDKSGAVDSIYSSTGLPAGKDVQINKKWYVTTGVAPIIPVEEPPVVIEDPPTPPSEDPPPVVSEEPLPVLDDLQEVGELAPVSIDNDLIMTNILAGTQKSTVLTGRTMIANNLPNMSNKGIIGAIANNIAVPRINIDDFTPIGAASQPQIGNTPEEKYDFIIQQTIYE